MVTETFQHTIIGTHNYIEGVKGLAIDKGVGVVLGFLDGDIRSIQAAHHWFMVCRCANFIAA